MSLPEMRTKIKARVWQAIAQSGVNLSVLSQPDVDKLVEGITEGVLIELDEILGQASGRPVSVSAATLDVEDEDEMEHVLWEGRPYLSLSVSYTITTERVRIVEGLLGKTRQDIELIRIQHIDHKQNLAERALQIGDVYIRSHDPDNEEIILDNVSHPEEVHEILRRAVMRARKKYNVGFREEM
jgi:hypothetical protein